MLAKEEWRGWKLTELIVSIGMLTSGTRVDQTKNTATKENTLRRFPTLKINGEVRDIDGFPSR